MNKLLSNKLGIILNVPALFLNFDAWAMPKINILQITASTNYVIHPNLNAILTLVISLLAIVWWLMKIYDTYISTKTNKRKEKL
ncbi:MAG: hypothetical protein JXR34_12275 [Bacteroidales bacterium]|nr:hypothetical protein [Bacteroidales bacterium]